MITCNAHLKLWLYVEDGCTLAAAEPLVEIAGVEKGQRYKFNHVVRGTSAADECLTSAAGVAFGDSRRECVVPACYSRIYRCPAHLT
jgi:hypothetical protein